MENKKRKQRVKFILVMILVIILIPVLLVAYLSLPWVMMYAFQYLPPYGDMPKIMIAEFPFELTYELSGQEITVNDSLVCKIDGIACNAEVGTDILWTSHLKSNKKRRGVFITEREGIQLFCSLGEPAYYMGDTEEIRENYIPEPRVFYTKTKEDGKETDIFPSDEYLYNEYGIRIIDWELSSPIENEFSESILSYIPFGPMLYKFFL